MRRLTLSLAAAVAGLMIAPNMASALSAIVADSTALRAGPAFDFPVVDRIPSDVRVNVHGCVRGYRWCDVSWRDARGWVPGRELAYLYQGRRVTIVEYGPRIGLPVIGFTFDTYWDRHYRGRSFYSNRSRWRTVWRDRDHGDRRTTDRDRDRDRREGKMEHRKDRKAERTDRTREETRRNADRRSSDRDRMDRRTKREDRPNVRTGRGDSNRGEGRGYNPSMKSAPRQEMDRGMRQGGGSGDRSGPSMGGDRGGQRGGQGGPDRGGSGQGGDRRP